MWPSCRPFLPLSFQQRTLVCWCGLGLLNNMPYVIMLALAKHVSEGSTATVYLANTCPGLLVKLSSSYWFDRVSYRQRLGAASIAMATAFTFLAVVTAGWWQLMGVAIVSLQIGMGEASLLALAGKYDKQQQESSSSCCILGFSAGTGLAGPMGFLWKVALTEWWGWSTNAMLCMGNVLAVFYWILFCVASSGKGRQQQRQQHAAIHGPSTPSPAEQDSPCVDGDDDNDDAETDRNTPLPFAYDENGDEQEMIPINATLTENFGTTSLVLSTLEQQGAEQDQQRQLSPIHTPLSDMTVNQRFRLVLSLWPFILPLFAVYAAEYACQAGAWTAIGFPADTTVGRAHFYETANWLYQTGSFVARSSGAFFTVSLAGLWIMPTLQVANLVIFSMIAAHAGRGMLYREPLLLGASLYTGLLGGAVYVHGYKRVIADTPAVYTEFALATTSAAEAVGVLVADVLGLYLQSCLYTWNGFEAHSVVTCPLP